MQSKHGLKQDHVKSVVSIMIKILIKCPCDPSSNVLMRTMIYFHEDEDKDEDIVIKTPRGRGQHEDTKIAVLGPRGRGHEDEDPMPEPYMSQLILFIIKIKCSQSCNDCCRKITFVSGSFSLSNGNGSGFTSSLGVSGISGLTSADVPGVAGGNPGVDGVGKPGVGGAGVPEKKI